ncbi:MAG: hypothetical protein ACLP1X_09745 [Polyangiaceae bacterium]|jgi:hypothetical protein
MTTPQNPGRRRRQKVRRTKQLTEWRAKQAKKTDAAPKAVQSPNKAASK